MTTTGAFVPRGGAKLVVDGAWVFASWFAANLLFRFMASPAELLWLPELSALALAALPVVAVWASLAASFGLYRPNAPYLGVRELAVLALAHGVTLAGGAGLVSVLGIDPRVLAIPLFHAALGLAATLGWRLFMRLVAPYGFDFSRLLRRHAGGPSGRLSVALRERHADPKADPNVRALPRNASRR